MRSTARVLGWVAAMLVTGAALAAAQSTPSENPPGSQPSGMSAQADAKASAEATASAEAIREKGAKASARTRAEVEAKLKTEADRVNSQADGTGEDKVAARLAADFGMTAQALKEEKQQLGASWGDLMIAHTLAANAKSDVTVQQLVAMHDDHTGWGQIAAGMGLELGEMVSAVRAEGRVALGKSRADGKVAVIHGEGARAGLDAGAGLGLGHARAGVGAGATAGVTLPKVKVGH